MKSNSHIRFFSRNKKAPANAEAFDVVAGAGFVHRLLIRKTCSKTH